VVTFSLAKLKKSYRFGRTSIPPHIVITKGSTEYGLFIEEKATTSLRKANKPVLPDEIPQLPGLPSSPKLLSPPPVSFAKIET
jgi:hypothetical protein